MFLNKTNNVINVRKLNHSQLITDEVADICLEHQNNNKWILVINKEDDAINQLSSRNNIDQSKILRVNSRKVKVNFNNIEAAITKGNCSAVVLCDKSFKQEQIIQLTNCANASNTKVFIFNQSEQLH